MFGFSDETYIDVASGNGQRPDGVVETAEVPGLLLERHIDARKSRFVKGPAVQLGAEAVPQRVADDGVKLFLAHKSS